MAQNIQALMARLQSLIHPTPDSTMSQAGNMDSYRQHVIQAQIQGQQPMTFEQFQQMMNQQNMQPRPTLPGLLGQ